MALSESASRQMEAVRRSAGTALVGRAEEDSSRPENGEAGAQANGRIQQEQEPDEAQLLGSLAARHVRATKRAKRGEHEPAGWEQAAEQAERGNTTLVAEVALDSCRRVM